MKNFKPEKYKTELKNIFSDIQNIKNWREDTLQQIAMSALQNQEEYNRLSYQVFTDKMLDIFKNNVKLNEKEVTFDEFVDIITEKNKELAEA